ncbi:MAG: sigma-70 family RNA polymerase sigma factor [Ruminococcus sp.]|nr:sigma-70 family RNA polymerase sigma factor [Ruminococcus sp.]
MTDEKILRLLKKDVRAGFEELIKQYSPYIGTIVRSRLGASMTADECTDITSDIFAEILSAIRSETKPIASLKAYISVIAVRHCIGVFRRRHSGDGRVPLDELPEPSENEARYERTELIELLRSLGEPDCEIFLRKYFLGQRSAEIAEAMKLRTNTVDQKISRGLKKLRKLIKE